jgi:parallel beta-helix repeat protein
VTRAMPPQCRGGLSAGPLGALVCSVVLAGACSGPSAPSSAPQVQTLTANVLALTGTPVLAIGQASQFAADTRAGQDVTRQSVWSSSNAAVVTASATGLVTGVGIGTATITAAYHDATGALQVVVQQAPESSPRIASCATIVLPGAYVLVADISQPIGQGACLTIGTSNVQLDCQNHSVSWLRADNVIHVHVTNCTTTATVAAAGGNNLTDVEFDHDTLLGGWHSNGSTGLTLSGNHVTGPGIVANQAEGSLIVRNTIDTPDGSSGIALWEGHDNQVLDNVIDGGYDGSGRSVGEDDGILLVDESADTVRGNTIRNVWDAGIEGVDAVTDTTVDGNTILNAGKAGIASYWCTHWTGNAILHNSVAQSPYLMLAIYDRGSRCRDLTTLGAFADSQVVGNIFRAPIGQAPGMLLVFDNLAPGATFNNLIRDNDLGSGPGPSVAPLSAFVDGGGNLCAIGSSPFCTGGGLLTSAPSILRQIPASRRSSAADAVGRVAAGISYAGRGGGGHHTAYEAVRPDAVHACRRRRTSNRAGVRSGAWEVRRRSTPRAAFGHRWRVMPTRHGTPNRAAGRRPPSRRPRAGPGPEPRGLVAVAERRARGSAQKDLSEVAP